MSDRTSAEIFGKVFNLLAENPTDEHRQIASHLYRFSFQYDFTPDQMYADEACITLGIAKKGPYPDNPEVEVTLFND